MAEQPRRIGLALGGGGGKGSAHIGVLSALEALQLPVDILAGTSIGGIVAAMYATGLRPYQIEQWFHRATAWRILERDPTNGGLLGTRKIEAMLRELFGETTFAETQVPLGMIAVDLRAGREVLLREGRLVDAVLATCAVPGLFPPVLRDDMVLVDGGVLNNVPVDVCELLGAQRVVGVDLGMVADDWTFEAPGAPRRAWPPRQWMPRSQIGIAERALMLMMAELTTQRLRRAPPAVLLRPLIAGFLPLDFTRTLEGRMVGERAVFQQRVALEALRAWRLDDESASVLES
jgi:NTE family protein